MTLNYIILVHKNPVQLKRMILSLSAWHSKFYVHVDKKADIQSFRNELEGIPNVVFIAEEMRCEGQWGSFGLVEATLNSLREIISDNRKGYCILLSGQDYPLKSKDDIYEFFRKRSEKDFITTWPMPKDPWWPLPDGMERLSRYKFQKSASRYDFVLFPSFFERKFYSVFFIAEFLKLVVRGHFSFIYNLFRKRRFPPYLRPYGGEQWFALRTETVKMMLNFVVGHPDYVKYHADTLVPDEVFLQSIIRHVIPDEADIYPSVTYANWERPNTVLPVTFTEDDFEELKTQPEGKLFARKFDMELDTKILDRLDLMVRC